MASLVAWATIAEAGSGLTISFEISAHSMPARQGSTCHLRNASIDTRNNCLRSPCCVVLDPAKARILYAVQGRISATLFASRTTQAAWKSKPTWYAVSTNDRTTSPDLERFLAKRMHAKTIELQSSHLSLISHPDQITNLILEAAGRLTQ
jgi:pimeloyl-ACP methyl ester carboxylesterase